MKVFYSLIVALAIWMYGCGPDDLDKAQAACVNIKGVPIVEYIQAAPGYGVYKRIHCWVDGIDVTDTKK